jgi:ABC-type branched-subunit amino acid transport system substrate-binding protein
MIKYPTFTKGATIGITAPSSGVNIELHDMFKQACKRMEEKGFKIHCGETVWMQNKAKSAPAIKRAQEFNEMMGSQQVDLIIPPWGGELLIEMLEFVDFSNMKEKWILGYSDISGLLLATTLVTGTAPAITQKGDYEGYEYIFRTSYAQPLQGSIASNFAGVSALASKAAVLFDSTNDQSKLLANSFIDAFQLTGGEMVGNESYESINADLQTILKKIKSSNAEFLYLPISPEDAGIIIKQAREVGLSIPIMGSDEWKSSNIVEIAGADALNNTFYTDHFSSEDTDRFVQEFVEDFQAKYNKIPDANAALGFDSVLLLADTIKFAEDKDPTRLMETLASTNGIELITGYIYLNDYHNPLKPGAVFEFKDGESVFKTRASH